MIQGNWVGDVADEVNEFGRDVRDLFVQGSGYPSLSVYVSYGHGDETLEARYGAGKIDRLRALKQEWDPHNVFAFNHGIRPS